MCEDMKVPAFMNKCTGNGPDCGTNPAFATTCPAGQQLIGDTNSVAGKSRSACEDCDSGKWSQGDGAPCNDYTTSCPAGFGRVDGDGTADATCALCAAGRFSPVNDDEECDAWSNITCNIGVGVVDGTASTNRSCVACAKGYYSAATNNAACAEWTNSSCPAGKGFSSGNATTDTSCATCVEGKFNDSAGTQCKGWTETEATCDSRSLDFTKGDASTDSSCAARKATQEPCARDISACPAGKYDARDISNDCANTDCHACIEGTYAAGETKRTACDECETGRYANTTGKDACAACVPGKYTNARGKSQCLPCSNTTVSSLDYTSCVVPNTTAATTTTTTTGAVVAPPTPEEDGDEAPPPVNATPSLIDIVAARPVSSTVAVMSGAMLVSAVVPSLLLEFSREAAGSAGQATAAAGPGGSFLVAFLDQLQFATAQSQMSVHLSEVRWSGGVCVCVCPGCVCVCVWAVRDCKMTVHIHIPERVCLPWYGILLCVT